ncbi:MAG: tetraacyldisaccharide 4'-kinase [Candidatus Omnitrophica bacterium]|nr:tetraacyldisaccharide 4'-kinase [Candidatus Omnitrophota bacterium]
MTLIRDFFASVLEQLYRLGIAAIHLGFRRKLFRVHRLPVPVISVGNLTWGGTGKTPLVMVLARALEKKGRRVAVLTRGYGGDEAALLTERLEPIPVLVDPDRVETGNRAVRELGADLLLMDDGFQQWRVRKDVEILMADGAAPFGNGRMIPRGNLREPVSEAARANLIVVKDSGLGVEAKREAERQLRARNKTAPIFFMRYQPTDLWRWSTDEKVPLDSLQGQKICTLSGIGHPASFETAVGLLGGKVILRHRFRDHHVYTAGELIRILHRCRQHGIGRIVTTAKDAVRLPRLLLKTVGPDLRGVELLVLEIAPVFEPNESELLHRIDSVLAGAKR